MAYVLGRRPGGSGGGGAPSGPAGGVLSGTYPNPGLSVGDAKGDLIGFTAADTAARLAVGSNGQALIAASGQSTGLQWQYPQGYELDYQQITSDVNITASSEATANTIVTASAISFDGSTRCCVEFFCATYEHLGAAGGNDSIIDLWDGSSQVFRLDQVSYGAFAGTIRNNIYARYFFTPSNASHTFSVRGWRTTANDGKIKAGTDYAPCFIRVTKA